MQPVKDQTAVLYQATDLPEFWRTFEAQIIFSVVFATMGHLLKLIILLCGYYIPLKLELKIFFRHLVTIWCQGNLGNMKHGSFTVVGNKTALLGKSVPSKWTTARESGLVNSLFLKWKGADKKA